MNLAQAVTIYVFVSSDNTNLVIQGGPFLWDGISQIDTPAGTQPKLLSDALAAGYSMPPVDPAALNAGTLRIKALAALTSNATYLAIPSPTNAQAVTQVAALTRQVNAIIRLLLGATQDISGT